MGLKVVALAILYSLTFHAVGVNAHNNFGDQTSGPKGSNLPSFTYGINNYLIYTLSKRSAKELNDESAESAIAQITAKILKESGIRGVVVNNRIINVFRKKICLLHAAFKKSSKRGGKCITQLINTWKTKSYSFKVFYHELQTDALLEENQELRGEKRKANQDLAEEQAKRLKLEEKLENVIKRSEKSTKFYKTKFRALAKKVAKLQKKGKRGPNKQTKFSDYTKQHQARIRQGMKEDCQATLSFLGLYNFIATKVEVYNNDSQQYETISLVKEGELQLQDSEPKEITDNDLDNINMWIYIKDKFNISNEAWHELAMKCKDMPSKYKLCKHLHEINSKWNLTSTPWAAEGVQISFKETLHLSGKKWNFE